MMLKWSEVLRLSFFSKNSVGTNGAIAEIEDPSFLLSVSPKKERMDDPLIPQGALGQNWVRL